MNFTNLVNLKYYFSPVGFSKELINDSADSSLAIAMAFDNHFLSFSVKQEDRNLKNFDLKSINVIGHRGNGKNKKRNDLPLENTTESYLLAISKGAQMIELDVHMTNDKKLVVYHDARITGKLIPQMSSNEFLRITRALGAAGNPETEPLESKFADFSTETTLEHIFDTLPEEFPIYVEIKYEEDALSFKNYPENYVAELVEQTIQLVLKYPKRKFMFASFSLTVCALLKTRLPNSFALPIINEAIIDSIGQAKLSDFLIGFIKTFKFDGLVFSTSLKPKIEDILEEILNFSGILMCYGSGANSEEDIKILKEFGVTGFTTDKIDICLSALSKKI